MSTNKRVRVLAGAKVLRRKVRKLGLSDSKISLELKKALGGRSIRISQRDDRKRFHTSKRYYGHFSGRNGLKKHLGRRDLQERAAKADEP